MYGIRAFFTFSMFSLYLEVRIRIPSKGKVGSGSATKLLAWSGFASKWQAVIRMLMYNNLYRWNVSRTLQETWTRCQVHNILTGDLWCPQKSCLGSRIMSDTWPGVCMSGLGRGGPRGVAALSAGGKGFTNESCAGTQWRSYYHVGGSGFFLS